MKRNLGTIREFMSVVTAVAVSFMLISCATQPFEAEVKGFQSKSNKALSAYTSNVSRGFARSGKSRGVYYDGDVGMQRYEDPNNIYGGQLLQSAIGAEVQDCVELIQDVPQTCENYNFMISSLSRCLDRVISYRNPIMTYAFRNLDQSGQRYWAYLLNWRRPSTYDFFLGTGDFGTMSGYAQQGYAGAGYGAQGY